METAQKGRVKPTPVCLTDDLLTRLNTHAEQQGEFSRSAIIRRACEEYLTRFPTVNTERQESAAVYWLGCLMSLVLLYHYVYVKWDLGGPKTFLM